MKNVFYCFWMTWPFSIALLLLSSCLREEPPSPRHLIVEGWIDSGDNPKVFLTTTVTPSEAESSNISDALIKWGKVVINDGEKDYILTGMSDTDYFPPYLYSDYSLIGKPGKTYTLSASFMEMKATAVTTILPPPTIDSITFSKSQEKGKQTLSLFFTPESASNEWYKVFVLQKGRDKRYFPGFMGTVATEGRTGSIRIPVSRGKHATDTLHYSSSFMSGDTVFIKLARIQRDAYEYWTDYQNAITLGGSTLISSSYDIRSNISGGFGYWFGYGVTKTMVVVP